MQELLKNAIDGFTAYTDAGKFVVLLFGALLWFWCQASSFEETMKKLMLYATVTSVLVLFPVTAVFLMKYQTRFYDYRWIFSMVPMTPVIACFGTGVYVKCCRDRWRGRPLIRVGFGALCVAVILLCGNLNGKACEGVMTAPDREKTRVLLDKLAETGDTDSICLWAPKEILAHVRRMDGTVKLLYGRNMWEPALNAYSYDSYDPETVALYEWMERLTAQDASDSSAREEDWQAVSVVMEAALDKGVNCIVIPEQKKETLLKCVREAASARGLSVTCDATKEYEIYRIRP